MIKLAELDLDYFKKIKLNKNNELTKKRGLIPWHIKHEGKTEIDDVGKAILDFKNYDTGIIFGRSRIKKFLKIFNKDKQFEDRIKLACEIDKND